MAAAVAACLRTVPSGGLAPGMRRSSKLHHQNQNQHQNRNRNRNENRQSSGLKLTGCRASAASSSSAKTKSIKPEAATTVELVASVRILREGLLDVASHAISDFFRQQKTTVYLVSLDSLDPDTKEGRLSRGEVLKFDALNAKSVDDTDSLVTLKFSVPADFGRPGAILVDDKHDNEFFLKTITVEVPGSATPVHFPCYSWIANSKLNGDKPRVFFSNQPYLPSLTPETLKKLRALDLQLLRGDGKGERKSGERIYDYAIYNDLGNPDSSKDLARPNLGGSSEYPYPRRCRTGRPPTKSDPKAEDPASLLEAAYLPRDERFSPQKSSLFAAAGLRSFGHDILTIVQTIIKNTKPFKSFGDIHDLYVGDLKDVKQPKKLNDVLQAVDPRDGTPLSFPRPGVVGANRLSWGTDQEFGRQRLAGANPLCIQRLTKFPIVSELDEAEYGSRESAITREHIEPYLGGCTVEDAIAKNELYILDYHDAILPYIGKINEGGGKMYASRTIFHLTKMGFLLPLAIELSLPPEKKGENGKKRVFVVPPPSVVDFEWRLAKTHVLALDSGIHELVSHWLRTHACVEPFIIATNRCLSTMHPLHTFLKPHFKDTMHINASARAALINAGGIIEKGFTPGKYSTEISSILYKGWRFDEQALPKDLIKRGMAVEDASARHGVRLLIQDYPYAEDGLEVWAAIERWATEYVRIYYKTDDDVKSDGELQEWWREIREIGHGDHAKEA